MSAVAVIAKQNDKFRKSLGASGGAGTVVVTDSVAKMLDKKQHRILEQLRSYSNWAGHGQEHRCGTFVLDKVDFYWCIDYYQDDKCEAGATDLTNCFRVLTIMKSDER